MKSKRKGYLLEHFCHTELKKLGLKVDRLAQANQPDLLINNKDTLECKCYAKGLKTIYKFLGKNKYLVIKWQSRKTKGKKPLVVLRWTDFKEFLLNKEVNK